MTTPGAEKEKYYSVVDLETEEIDQAVRESRMAMLEYVGDRQPYRVTSLGREFEPKARKLIETYRHTIPPISPVENIIHDAIKNLLHPYYHQQQTDLSPEVINLVLNIFRERYKDKKIEIIDARIKNIETYLNRFDDFNDSESERLKDADTIFWPINQGNHWYLLIVNKRINEKDQKSQKNQKNQKDQIDFVVEALDGKNQNGRVISANQKQQSLMVHVEHLLKKLFGVQGVQSTPVPIPRQDKDTDSALAMLYMAEKSCDGYPLWKYDDADNGWSMNTCDYTEYRLYLVSLILNYASSLLQNYKEKETFTATSVAPRTMCWSFPRHTRGNGSQLPKTPRYHQLQPRSTGNAMDVTAMDTDTSADSSSPPESKKGSSSSKMVKVC